MIEKSCDCFGLDENQLSLLMKGCFCWRSLEGVKHDDVTWQLVELYGFVELRHVRSTPYRTADDCHAYLVKLYYPITSYWFLLQQPHGPQVGGEGSVGGLGSVGGILGSLAGSLLHRPVSFSVKRLKFLLKKHFFRTTIKFHNNGSGKNCLHLVRYIESSSPNTSVL